jgi:hypothetical protein
MNSKSEYAFVVAGLVSALLTLILGAFSLIIFVLGTGVIFSIALFTTDSMLLHGRPVSGQTPLSRRLLAGLFVALSYTCGVICFVAFVSLVDRLGIDYRNFLGLIIAGVVSSFGFYWALRILFKVKRAALIHLVLISLSAAIISGSSAVWGKKFMIIRPHWFISPVWVTLLVIGETGFAWVWGNQIDPQAD